MVSFNSYRVRRFTLVVAVIFAAAIGSMASTTAGTDSWYLSLNKSELNPPSYVFGIVWPILYILMMISAFLAYKKVFLFFNPIVPRISSVFNRSIVILDFFLIFPYTGLGL